uniref:hemolysin family protein n=1 Tax=Thaumasiovibrio occultus TaxID=1891184 RepID=UPI000B35E7E4|nr:hemolysin family protein [Thaumasiovibrio occultus]
MDVALLALLILLNGGFAMSEIALVSAKPSRLQRKANQGEKSAAVALALKKDPTLFLSTIQIGITAIGLCSGIAGEAVLSAPLMAKMIEHGIEPDVASVASTAIVVVGITYFSIVYGELVPKRFAQAHAERIATLVAIPIKTLAMITAPFVKLLSGSTNITLKALRVKEGEGESDLTEDDLQAFIREGTESGIIHQHEQDMLLNIFKLNDRKVCHLMTPRINVEFIDLTQPIETIRKQLRYAEHSMWPVCRGGIQDLIGTVSAKSLLRHGAELDKEKIARSVKAPIFIPESTDSLTMLGYLQNSSAEVVFVVDEYGDIQGLATSSDLLEAIAGELVASDPRDHWVTEDQEGAYIIDALMPVGDAKERLTLDLKDDEDADYQTLNGMLMWFKGDVPQEGDVITVENWHFEVLSLKHNRIDRVRVTSTLVDETSSEADVVKPEE